MVKELGYKIENSKKYFWNRLLHMAAFAFFAWTPMGMIYGNRIRSKRGFWILVVMISCGIFAD